MNHSAIENMILKVSEGTSIHHLCSHLSAAIHNPVAVSNLSETLIGHSSDFDREFIDEFTSSAKFMSKDELNDMHESFNAIVCTGKAHIQAWPYLRHKQVTCGCLYRGVPLGVLLIPLPNTTQVDFETIEAAAQIIGIWFAANGFFVSKNAHPEQRFLTSLVRGEIDMALQRGELSNLVFTDIDSFRVIWIQLDDELNEIFRPRLAKLCKQAKQWWHIAYEQGYVILLNARCDSFFDELSKLLSSSDAVGCISDEYQNIAETRTHLNVLRTIVNLPLPHSDDAHPLFFADDYKLLIALSAARKHTDPFMFTNETLARIIEYDALHSSFYLETLRVCFQEHRDYKKMAVRLGIHKNSVFYRMNKLSELFDVNLDNVLQASSLYYALLIYDGIL